MMRLIPLIFFLGLLLYFTPAFADERYVVDFRDYRPIPAGELINLTDLIERKAHGYSGQMIVDVAVYARTRNRHSRGYVQLLDDRRRIIAEEQLRRGYANLPVYEGYRRTLFLHFEDEVVLDRVEITTEGYSRRPYKQKELRIPKKITQIGDFVKADYKPEVKRFSLENGGFSRINFRVHIGEQHAVIVNSILVLADGRKLEAKTVGARLSEGDNEFSLDVPDDATDIQVSFAHGKGSSVQVFLIP